MNEKEIFCSKHFAICWPKKVLCMKNAMEGKTLRNGDWGKDVHENFGPKLDMVI